MQGGQPLSLGHVQSHRPTQCEVHGCNTLREADIETTEGNAHSHAAVLEVAWKLQSHQQLLINSPCNKAV